ncbi:PQQ-binding-like beta-propeller repeat protein [Sorangium sp. So ce375]|uniref:PQQ-binding-like beta-propeller repeat protein n=1 Tax=Sorangium sp. So ce375 TaxID=3133306 RepID=UPI003F5B4FAD
MPGLSLVADNTRCSPEPERTSLHDVLDFVLEGARNASPPLDGAALPLRAEAEALPLLCELAEAAAELASGRRARAVVRLCLEPDPWELGLERVGRDLLVTVFHGGDVPEVALHERRFDGEALCARLLAAMDRFAAHRGPGARRDAAFADNDAALGGLGEQRLPAARRCLAASLPFSPDEAGGEPAIVGVEPTGEIPIAIAAEALLRTSQGAALAQPAVLRADLFSLLFRGKIRVLVGEEARELPDVFIFPFAEQLTSLSLESLDAWARRQPYHRRLTVGGAILGVRLHSEGALSLTLGVPRVGRVPSADPRALGPGRAPSFAAAEERAQTWTFPAVDVAALAQGVVAFGRALARSLVRRDRGQTSNLRLFEFRARVRELAERLRELTRNDAKINVAPETYRAFAAAAARPQAAAEDTFGRTRLRFTARWIAAIPSVDLRATFLCGDVLVVGSTRELTCLDRRTGECLWRKQAPRAVSVMTPVGLGRLLPDGTLQLHDLSSGEVAWSTRLSPRVGANASGAVVSAPGLPRMLIVSEGTRHLAAVDLYSGEVRWRYAARRGENFRLRRAGKLVLVGSGEPALAALDVLSGEVVWRFCDRLPFASPVAVDHDALFALAGDGAFVGRGGARLHHLDPWSGEARWTVDLPKHVAPVGAPLLGPETVCVVTHGRRGTGLVGIDRRTGATRFDLTACAATASCLMVDDVVVVNSEAGEIVGVGAHDGAVRYRHVIAGGVEGDRPRRLEPVLRSGALFVPQSEVHVVRPRDGALLGKVPTDLIPDLLRVDERCDVYVAEESGHLAAFAAAPRLSLVQ